MNLGSYVESIRRELAVAAESGSDEARAVAERLIASVGSAVRLSLLEALAAAADEITRELAPGSVHMTLRGREPGFVVVVPPTEHQEPASPAAELPAPPSPPDATDGATSRINFRPPETLKARIEEAAAKEGLSVNAWLVRATSAALDSGQPRDRRAPRASGGRFTGWVG